MRPSLILLLIVGCGRAVPGAGYGGGEDDATTDGGTTGDGALHHDGGVDAPPWVSCTSSGFPSVAWPTTGSSPMGAAVGDFNADGRADIAIANQGDGTISVVLGSGGGAFLPKADYPAGSAPTSVATGDFNSDLKPDLVVGGASGSSVAVLLGNDDGTFQAQRLISTGSTPWGVATGDLDADGKTDIIVARGSRRHRDRGLRQGWSPGPRGRKPAKRQRQRSPAGLRAVRLLR